MDDTNIYSQGWVAVLSKRGHIGHKGVQKHWLFQRYSLYKLSFFFNKKKSWTD